MKAAHYLPRRHMRGIRTHSIASKLGAALVVVCFSTSTFANEECAPLEPKGGENVSDKFTGIIEGEIEGIVSRIAGGAASIEGEYERLVQDTLHEYPRADNIIAWQTLIYLICVRPDSQIDLTELFEMYLNGPPQQ